MGWFANLFNKWATGKQRQELSHFVSLLRAMDGVEVGHVVALATHVRHQLEAKGHNPMDPIVYTAINPGFPLLLSRTTIELQKQHRPHDAAAFMVWAHTARAGVRLELRGLGRELWRELTRGFDHVEEGALSFQAMSGVALNIDGAREYPKGLTPDPL